MGLLIRHADGREYEAADVETFERLHQGAGFVIVATRNAAGEWIPYVAQAKGSKPAAKEIDDDPAKKAGKA